MTRLSPFGPTGPAKSIKFSRGLSTCKHLLEALRQPFLLPDAVRGPYQLFVVHDKTGKLEALQPEATLLSDLLPHADSRVTIMAEAWTRDKRVSMHTFILYAQ